jgi:hypothetical protein
MLKHILLIPESGKDKLGWRVVGNLQIDWLWISSILGTITFVVTNTAVFVWLISYRSEIIRAKGRSTKTTFDWKIIGQIVLQCTSFSSGIILILNVLISMLTGIWNVDIRSIGIMVLAFALMLFRSFDSFLTELRQRRGRT